MIPTLSPMAVAASILRIGVIGYGQWGPNHVRSFRAVEGAEVVRVCDALEPRLALARSMFPGLGVTTKPADVFAAPDIDAVVVATPARSHFALARDALVAGKDVLCEKPLATTVEECRALCELARQAGRILMVGHVFLYHPCLLHLKADLDRGEFGKIYSMDAVRTNLGPVRQDVGALADLASHDIAIFNHLLGATPLTVSATGGFFLQKDVEDIGFLTLAYPQGVVCHAHSSWLSPRKVRQLTVVGDRRMAVWDDMNNLEPIRYYDKGVAVDHYASFGEFQLVLRDGTITIPRVTMNEPLLLQDREFARCIRERVRPSAAGEFGMDVARVLEAARESLRSGGREVSVASG